ncbi:MAG: macro domain-containing protein [Gemmatimonadota bacterium]
MIRVVLSGPENVESEAILRSVSSDLGPDTTFSRELEIRAGPGVAERLQALGELPVGAAVITPGGELSVGFIIHVVLQSVEERVTPQGLRSALHNGLRRAEEWGLKTLALPPLGTGAGNMDADEAAAIMVPLISDHLQRSENPREVLIVVGTGYERDVFAQAVESVQGHISSREN